MCKQVGGEAPFHIAFERTRVMEAHPVSAMTSKVALGVAIPVICKGKHAWVMSMGPDLEVAILLCSHFSGWNSVSWPYLTARVVRKYHLAVCSERTGEFGFLVLPIVSVIRTYQK